MKKVIEIILRNALLLFLFLLLTVFVFMDDHVFVGVEVWAYRLSKIMTYIGIALLFGMGIRIMYGALFASNTPGLGAAIFLSCIAGIFIFMAFVSFKYRQKVWAQ